MRRTDGGPLQIISALILAHTRRETYIRGKWKPPTKFVEGVPLFWFISHCMRVLREKGRTDGIVLGVK